MRSLFKWQRRVGSNFGRRKACGEEFRKEREKIVKRLETVKKKAKVANQALVAYVSEHRDVWKEGRRKERTKRFTMWKVRGVKRRYSRFLEKKGLGVDASFRMERGGEETFTLRDMVRRVETGEGMWSDLVTHPSFSSPHSLYAVFNSLSPS